MNKLTLRTLLAECLPWSRYPERCSARNGTYACYRSAGHFGDHVNERIIPPTYRRGNMVAVSVWSDEYASEVRTYKLNEDDL